MTSSAFSAVNSHRKKGQKEKNTTVYVTKETNNIHHCVVNTEGDKGSTVACTAPKAYANVNMGLVSRFPTRRVFCIEATIYMHSVNEQQAAGRRRSTDDYIVVDRLFMKLFKTNNTDIVRLRQQFS